LKTLLTLPKVGEVYEDREILADFFDSGYFSNTLVGLENASDCFDVKKGFVRIEFYSQASASLVDPKEAEQWDIHVVGLHQHDPLNMN
jgi:hypothetical protein